MICDMIYQDMTWLNIIPLLFNCLIFFTCSDDCTEKIVYWWREIRNEIHKVVVYVNEEIDTDVITFHYSSMLKGRQREWERERVIREKSWYHLKKLYALFLKFHTMLHITILSGNNNCVLVFFFVLFTNSSLLETQILGNRSLSGNPKVKQINRPIFPC